ncbi:MAG: tetratricopeptide (TPR) repeat protein [Planctomycetota bacterium]|jgi:tetratricopeptide (TPR) repeat protein
MQPSIPFPTSHMKPALLFPIVLSLSVAAGAAGAKLFGSPSKAAGAEGGAVMEVRTEGTLETSLNAINERLAALEAKQDQWLAAPRQNVQGPDSGEPASTGSGNTTDSAAQAAAAALPAGPASENPEDWFAAMTSGNLSASDVQKLWDKAVAEGRVDDLIALFKARAEADPNNPNAQNDLGDAYIQKVQVMGSGPKAGFVAARADKAFSTALELDPNHLAARRSKAIALSFWPPIMGKQSESIQQFEVLIEKQNLVPVEPDHVQAYMLLGNMHMQMGKIEEARTTWQNGLSRFPGNEGLMRQLELIIDR